MAKKINLLALCAVLATTILSTQTCASEVAMTSGQFREACSRADNDWISFCNGYAQALVDFSELSGRACFPSGMTRTEIVTMIDKLAFEKISSQEISPETPAFLLVMNVLGATFPCN